MHRCVNAIMCIVITIIIIIIISISVIISFIVSSILYVYKNKWQEETRREDVALD